MAQIGREFRLEWKTAVNEFTVRVSIYETDYLIPDGDIPEVINLQQGANPLIFSTIDNDRDKFTTIRGKQAVITFVSDAYDINTFFDGQDDKWLVVITLPDTAVTLFKGYLILNDLQQAFLPDPVEVVLTATDRLGTLKDIELSNTIGLDDITGKILISIYIAHCLRSTGLRENINVQYNIREIDSNDFHLFDKNYLDALTFEDEVGTLQNCYEVLEKILGMSGFVTQYKGEWFIKRVDEFDNAIPDYVAVFDDEGNYVSISNGYTYLFNIGALSNAKWCNANQLLGSDRPHKLAALEYVYELPKELPCNVDFERGDYQSDVSATEKKYDLDCWTLKEGDPTAPTTVDGTTSTIHRLFNTYETETERYIVLTPRTTFETSSINDATYIQSTSIEVQEKDRFEASIDFRLASDIGTGGGLYRLFRFILAGHDGSLWILGNESTFDPTTPLQWKDTANWTLFTGTGVTDVDFDEDDTEWRTVSYSDVPPVPTDGYLYAMINQLNQFNNADDDIDIYYSSLSFTLYPYVNGSYRKFTSHENKVSRTTYQAKKEERIYLDSMPHPVYKGMIFRFDDGVDRYVRTTQFYDHSRSPLAVPPTGNTLFSSFDKLVSFDVWNQFKAGSRILEGDVIGLDATNPPDVIHQYVFTNTNPNLLPRSYMCVSFEQDWKTEIWKGSWIECYNASVGREFTDTHELKYLTNG